jgi:tyrocidine synthetase-3
MNKDFKLDKKNIENIFDLTALQEGMLFHYLNSAKSNIYCAQLSLEIDGLIIKDYFQEAWNKVIENNEMLRIVFRWEKLSKPIQIILKEINVDIRYCDFTGKESSVIDTDIQDIKLKDYTEGFDLREVPFRLTLCKLNNNKYNLLISNHHIIYDGWSNGIILNEFINYYHKLINGSCLKINKKTPFNQYVKLNKEFILKGKDFWKDYLNGYEVNSVFRSKTNNLLLDRTNECYNHVIKEDKVHLLKKYCELHRLTIADILYNVWGILLSKYSGIEDILFGTTVSGRNIKLDGIEKMVGLFINTIPLRLILPVNKPLIEIIKENSIHLRKRGGLENVPLQEILNSSGFKGDELFESIFVIENYPIDKESLQHNDELTFTSFSIKETTNYKLTVSALITDEIELNFNYNNTCFENNLIERIGKHYARVVDWIINEKESDIISLDILTEEEKHQLLYEFNDTQADYPKDKTIHQLFEEQVARTPEKDAVCCGGNVFTYSELNKKANVIAHHIQEIGIDSNDIVTIFLDRSIETIFSMLGVLKSGGAYLPLDPDYPNNRIDFILNDSRSKILITTKDLSTRIEFNRNIICVEDLSVLDNNFSNIEIINNSSDLCYIIYTSGTTDNPKGVMVEHRNVVRLFFNDKFQFDFSEKDVWTMFHSHCFDFSVWEMYGALLYGGKLIVIPKIVSRDVDKYYKLLSEEKVTVLNQTPSAFYNLLEIALRKPDKSLENLRYVIFGGEALKPIKLAEWFNIYSDVKLINMYGITETTVHVTYKEISKYEIENNISNIGTPIPTLTTYVVDNNLRLVPKGIAGELLIGGDGVSRGYLGREDLTRDRFIKNSYNEEERLYRSGDLVKMLSNGELEYLGRIDDQVQLRGFRIELGEIENALVKHEHIKESVVLVREENGDKSLCAYMVSKEGLNHEELRTYMSAQLPEYMIPSYFVELDKIPLTSNGKIDRKSLPVPAIKAGLDYVAPQTLIESKLVKIWSEVLKVASKEISTNVSFFELGGHSLKATVLVSRIHKELDVQIELREVFQSQTIEAQAKIIGSKESISCFSIPKAKEQAYYSLSSSQRRLYLLQQMDLGSTTYIMSGLIAVPEGYDKHQIEDVFHQLIARHENFRTSFEVENEIPVQRIHSEVSFSIKEYQITSAELSKVRGDFVQAFDLSDAPLLRVGYLEISDGDDMLLIDIHHIISDGRSHAILEEDFTQLLAGKELEPLGLQYKDYSEWQNSSEQQSRIKGQESYWLDKFAGELPVLELPIDYSRPVMQDFEGASVGFKLSEEETKIIHDLIKEQGLTLYMSLLSVFTILLSKLSGQEDIIVGSPIAARRHSDLENIVGMFVNTLAIRSGVSGDKQLIDYLQELKENTLEAYENQEYQFEDLVEKLVLSRDTGRNPLFDVMFNLLEGEYQEVNDSSKEDLIHTQGISKFDLSLTVLDLGLELELSFEYSTKLFNPETIERFINYFRQLIQSISVNQEQKIKALNILPEEEKQQLLYKFNDTKRDYPKDKIIHQLFEEQEERTPDRVVLIYNDQIITYRELNSRSNQLGYILKEKGFKTEKIAGILVDRSIEMLIGILGILKAGGAYLPLDPFYPESRINYILENSKSQLILCSENYRDKIDLSFQSFILEEGLFTKGYTSNLDISIKTTELCYVIYTSGSTGTPKGVNVEHLSVLNLLYFLQDQYPINGNDSYLLKTSYCFDVSISELFGWIQGGGKLCILETGQEKDAVKIIETINKSFVTHINFVPSVFNLFSDSISGFKKDKLISLKYILLAGEALLSEHLKTFKSYGLDIQIDNLYGPTEATVYTSYYSVDLDEVGFISIGRPLFNYEIYLLDKNLKLEPIGVSGELCIGGLGLSRGYLNNPDLTSDKFIDHPFKEGERLYRTGDLARWLPDGNIEFLGRIDDQVKIRGFRIELGEIESTLLKHLDVTDAVVLSRENSTGDKYLCSYIVSNSQENNLEESLRKHLSGLLPDYMIPSYFVELDKIPLTSNGKIDRKSLPVPAIKVGLDYIAPQTLIESKLVKIWSEVLNVTSKEISTNVSFFELGGHSLKATVLVSRIHKELDVRIELRDIFQYQSVQSQSELIGLSESTSYFSIPKAKIQEYYPLSSSQRRLYLLQQMDMGSTAYNMSGLIAVPEGQNKNQITDVFNKLIAHHENFRTSFEVENEIPVQRIYSEVSFSIKEYQITSAELSKVRKDFVHAFDLSDAPLLRVGYLEISDGDDMLLIDMHHIISDGRSHSILEEEFYKLIAGENLEPLRLQYKDYSEWQNSSEQQSRIKGQESYWLDKFAGELPVLELPIDYSRPVMQDYEGASVGFKLSEEETKIIHDLSKEQGLTLYMSLLSIFTMLLSKLSGKEDIVVGSPIAARRHTDLEDVVGMFVNTLAMRNDVSGDKRLIDYLQELKENTLGAYENQEYQFEDLVEKLVLNRDTGRNPLFDVMFSLLEGEFQEVKDSSKEELKHIQGISKFDLSLTALDLGSEIHLSFEYSTKLFNPETIERFINYFRQLIQSLSANQDQKIKDLTILPEEEKRQLLYKFNDTKRDYPKGKTIHQLFEEQEQRTPYSVALVFEDQVLTYKELNSRSNQLANYLVKEGRGDSVIGILMNRSLDQYIAILGVLKMGKGYLPLDYLLPEARIKYMLSDSNVNLVLGKGENQLPGNWSLRFINVNSELIANEDVDYKKVLMKSTSLAYIIYTSGSTGNPKGVLVGHRGVVNLITSQYKDLNLTTDERILQFSNLIFDASIEQIWLALLKGNTLIVVDNSTLQDVNKMFNLINKLSITHLNSIPSYLNNLNIRNLKSIRRIVSGGEICSVSLAKKLISVPLYNQYGPTEVTVTGLKALITELEVGRGRIPIGSPLNNTEVYILDKQNYLQPIGVSGELCISGVGLSEGYLNNPELTHEKFISHPFIKGDLLYKTGDLVRWLPDGNIEFLGRLDHQVKIRGFRIELGEIESVILKHDKVKECVVLAREENTDKYLCAYLVLKAQEKNIEQSLRLYLSGLLPDYMIPTYFVELEKIPQTSNGKIDRKSLPTPEIKAGEAYVAPQTFIESKLVRIWSEVLNIPIKEISTRAGFFELGGHSLKATVLVFRIHKELEVRLELRDVFQFQTVQGQVKLINSSESSSYFSIPKAKVKACYPLSSSQRRLYFLQQMDLGNVAYNMPGLIAVPKGQDKQKIKEVFNKLIARHENFRTSFEVENEIPVQRIHSEVSFSIKEYQITSTELSKVRKDFVQAFDLSVAPLIRVGYLEISDGDDMLLIDMHHIISDGRSHSILEEEFYKLIAGKDLEPLGLQYKDYSEWQNSEEQQERIKGQESYWLNKFAGELPVLELPIDYSRPVMQNFEGASVGFKLSEEEIKIIHDLSKEQGLTLYMSLLSVFTILLSKLTGQEDIIVGSPIAARRHSDLENIVGMFVNTLAIRSGVSGDKQLIDYLQELKENTLEAYENQEYQFEDLVEKLVLSRDTGRNPLFDVMFNLLEGEYQEVNDSSKEDLIHTQGISKFDLSLTVLDLGLELELSFEYSTKLFSSESINWFIKYFKQIINEMSFAPYKLIGEISLITEIEKRDIRKFGEGRKNISKNELIHELFSKKVEENPLKEALVLNDNIISYRLLDERSNSLARTLRNKGVKANDIVGLMVERSFEMIIGILGILKSGAACLPIDLSYPEKRKTYMLKDCDVKFFLINKKQDQEKIETLNFVKVIGLNNESNFDEDNSALSLINTNKDLIYVIYTSGSTGQPKGVMLEHRNLVNLIENNKYLNVELEKVLQFNSVSFDVSFQEIFSTLLYGGTLYLINDDERKEIPNLFDLVKKHSISTVFFPTAYLKTIFNDYEDIDIIPPCIKHVVTAGEQLTISDVFKNYLKQKQIYLHNHYGPSETHVVTTLTIEPNNEISEFPSIGHPIQNTSVFILDRFKNIQPIGIAGELYIEGASVGRGYIGGDLLTSEKFISNPFKEGERLYKTGDLARWLPDGNIEFLGRLDHQVKIRGFRIELGEIESNLLNHADVKDCVVICLEDQRKDKYLCAYIVSYKEGKEFKQILRSYLSDILPNYMIPSQFVFLTEIPKNNNGKVDVKALPKPIFTHTDNCEEPSSEIEFKLQKIWSDILDIPVSSISINDGFFEIGGQSLKASILCLRIDKNFKICFPLKAVFQNPTIKLQAKYIKSVSQVDYQEISLAEKKEYYPLSSSQARYFIMQNMYKDEIAYNNVMFYSIRGDIEYDQICLIFKQIVQSHEILRTSFKIIGSRPCQIVNDQIDFNISRFKFNNIQDLKKIIKPFDLSGESQIRVALFEKDDDEYILAIDLHSIVADGISLNMLLNKFIGLLNNKNLSPQHLHYKDFSIWEKHRQETIEYYNQKKFWLDMHQDYNKNLNLPYDSTNSTRNNLEGLSVEFLIEKEELTGLYKKFVTSETTLFNVLISVLDILLNKITSETRITIGVPVSGRPHADFEKIIGYFANVLAIKQDVDPDIEYLDFLKEVTHNIQSCMTNQEYPFDALVNDLHINQQSKRNPIFDVMLVFQNMKNTFQRIESDDIEIDVVRVCKNKSKMDWHLSAMEKEGVIKFEWTYSFGLFAPQSMDLYINYFKNIIKSILENPKVTLSDIELTDKKEIVELIPDEKFDYEF